MKLTAQIKLQNTEDEHDALLSTMKKTNEACNYISQRAWETETFRQFPLQQLCYHYVRSELGLSAQITVRAVAKVTDAYKLDRETKRTFKPLGAISYDSRILSWNLAKSIVSIWTVAGRLKIPFACGERQRKLLETQQGESDLVYRDGTFYLFTTCNVEDVEPTDVSGFLGVDRGIVNVATDSVGNNYDGTSAVSKRQHLRSVRSSLQRAKKMRANKGKSTQSARKRWHSVNHREKNFSKTMNHVISKRIVETAKALGLGIALENLKGIRERVTVRKQQRYVHNSWSFYDLQQKIMYKAALAGLPTVFVDPRNTSRTCPKCGYCHKHNRTTQSEFRCRQCGYEASADYVGALNIALRAVVNPPQCAAPA